MVAVATILCLHAVILTVLALVPATAVPDTLIFVDLSPVPGEGAAIGSASVPTRSKANPADNEPEASADAERADESEEAKPSQDVAADEAEPTETAAQSDPVIQASGAPRDPAGAGEPSVDVLAMVEKLTGSDAATVSQPLPVTAAVSAEQMRALQQQAAQAWASRSGGGCPIDALIKEGLKNDPAAQAALIAIPSANRSVSNALQLWDGQWTLQVEPGAADPLAPVRTLAQATVEAAAPACRNAPLKGPRFLIVPLKSGADMVIVIGSGDWRWSDILAPRSRGIFGWLGL